MGRRLRDKAVQPARAEGPGQSGVAAARARGRAGNTRSRPGAARPGDPPCNDRGEESRARSDGVPAASFLPGAPRTRPHTRAIARSGMGRSGLHRGTHGRRPYTAPSCRAGAARLRGDDRDRAWHRLPSRRAALSALRARCRDKLRGVNRPIFAVVMAPMGVALATLVAWLAFGTGWALATLAVGAAVLVGFHLWHLDMLVRWAEGPVDGPIPGGRGTWQRAFPALYRRARARVAAQRGLAQRLERFAAAAEAIPEAIVVLDD